MPPSSSILSGAHNALFPRITAMLRERGAGDMMVFGGGIIPEADIPGLLDAGIRKIFSPGASLGEIVQWVRENVRPRGVAA